MFKLWSWLSSKSQSTYNRLGLSSLHSRELIWKPSFFSTVLSSNGDTCLKILVPLLLYAFLTRFLQWINRGSKDKLQQFWNHLKSWIDNALYIQMATATNTSCCEQPVLLQASGKSRWTMNLFGNKDKGEKDKDVDPDHDAKPESSRNSVTDGPPKASKYALPSSAEYHWLCLTISSESSNIPYPLRFYFNQHALVHIILSMWNFWLSMWNFWLSSTLDCQLCM